MRKGKKGKGKKADPEAKALTQYCRAGGGKPEFFRWAEVEIKV